MNLLLAALRTHITKRGEEKERENEMWSFVLLSSSRGADWEKHARPTSRLCLCFDRYGVVHVASSRDFEPLKLTLLWGLSPGMTGINVQPMSWRRELRINCTCYRKRDINVENAIRKIENFGGNQFHLRHCEEENVKLWRVELSKAFIESTVLHMVK